MFTSSRWSKLATLSCNVASLGSFSSVEGGAGDGNQFVEHEAHSDQEDPLGAASELKALDRTFIIERSFLASAEKSVDAALRASLDEERRRSAQNHSAFDMLKLADLFKRVATSSGKSSLGSLRVSKLRRRGISICSIDSIFAHEIIEGKNKERKSRVAALGCWRRGHWLKGHGVVTSL